MTEGGRDGRGTEIWTFGGNACGQLGQGDKVRRLVPTPIESLRGLDVLSVACGLYHTVSQTTSGGLMLMEGCARGRGGYCINKTITSYC